MESKLILNLSVRPITFADISLLINYWLTADEAFLKSMGADIKKVPAREHWEKMLHDQVNSPLEEKKSYCIIWLADNLPVGHSNASDIIFGKEAHMHLHLWNPEERQKGWGTAFVKKTLPFFFKDLHIRELYCEPYAVNLAPNKTLARVGFSFVKEYITVPGWLNFEQPVKQWKLGYDDFKKMT